MSNRLERIGEVRPEPRAMRRICEEIHGSELGAFDFERFGLSKKEFLAETYSEFGTFVEDLDPNLPIYESIDQIKRD